MAPPKITPIRTPIVYLDTSKSVTIGNATVDLPTLARAYQVDRSTQSDKQVQEDQTFSYEDIQAFCKSNGMNPCLSVKQYNRLAYRFAFQDPRRAFLGAWIGNRDQMAAWFRELTRQTGHFQHWRLLKTRLSVSDLDFLMESFRALPRVEQQRHAKEFIETWSKITGGKFDTSAEIRDPIEAFNLFLILDPDVENYRTVTKELAQGISMITKESLGVSKSKIYPWAAEYLRVPKSDEALARVNNELQKVIRLNAEDLPYVDRAWIPDRAELIGPLRQHLAVSEQMSPDAAKTLHELLRSSQPEVFERALRAIQAEADRMSESVLQEVRAALLVQLRALRGLIPAHDQTHRNLHQITLMTETAQILGGRFEDFGESYSTIEERLYGYLDQYPGQDSAARRSHMPRKYLSERGFLGAGDRLGPTLEQDAVALSKLEFTAREVAQPLKAIRDYFFDSPRRHFAFEINGRVYEIERLTVLWSQSCPFLDSTENHQVDLRIKDTETGDVFFFPTLVAHLIDQHGFFEGKNAGNWGGNSKEIKFSYRIEPERVIQFFRLKPKQFSSRPI